MVDVKSDVIMQGLNPDDIFRPNLAAEIDDTRTWVSPEGYRLSDRLWMAKGRDRHQINKILATGLAQGDSPLQTAKRLEYLLNPYYQLRRDPETFRVLPKSKQPPGVATTTPRQGPGKGPARPRNSGTGSYAARRLARTELTRAFGAAAIRAAKANPLVRAMRWRMSAHHHDSDQCDRNATRGSRDLPGGVWKLDEIPRYPDHPHEMCTLNPYVTQADIDDAIPRLRRAMQDGDFSAAGLARPFPVPPPPPPPPPPATPVAPKPRAKKEKPGVFTQAELDELAALKREWDAGPSNQKRAELANRAGEIVNRRVRENIPASYDKLREAEAKYTTSRKALDDLKAGRALRELMHDDEYYRLSTINNKDFEEMMNLRKKVKGNPWRKATVDTLNQVRPMGSTLEHDNVLSMKVAQAAVQKSGKVFPTEWWEESVAYGPLHSATKQRAYHRSGGGPGKLTEVHVSGDKKYKEEVAIHEMTHRMEYVRPALAQAEAGFYARRTQGEELRHLGAGYPQHEVYRPDQFTINYSGKDYGGRAWELATMGTQDLLREHAPPGWLLNDQDYHDFVVGLLAIG